MITREQRVAIKQQYDRMMLDHVSNIRFYANAVMASNGIDPDDINGLNRAIQEYNAVKFTTYRQFRRNACGLGMDGVVFVRLPHIIIGIERDGYAHT